MRKCVNHRMTVGQLARFTSANGLCLDGSGLFTPDGKNIGRVRLASPRTFDPISGQEIRGAPLILSVFQESYILPAQADRDGCVITAWWPAFRPAWTLVTGDGDVEVGDLCNAEVTIRPVPMVGSYALCTACFARQGMSFPGTVGPYCVLPIRDCEEVGNERRGV
jgi:hypothetical protein